MATINLIIQLSNSGFNYIDSTVRYGRIDNNPAPSYITINNVSYTPLIISNVPAGQYRIYAKPNYSDGRICPESVIETDPCTGITSLSAIFDDPFIVVSYTCDPDVPKVRINVQYPNGGFSNTIVNNDEVDVNITPPAGVYGTYLVTIQPVCDADTGWFGQASAPVTVEIPVPSP